jgi:hypothetical protein
VVISLLRSFMLPEVLCRPTFVPMMETAHLRPCNHSPRFRRFVLLDYPEWSFSSERRILSGRTVQFRLLHGALQNATDGEASHIDRPGGRVDFDAMH